MLPKYLLLIGAVAAAPAEHEDATVRKLKAAPGAHEYCASLLHIPTATITITKSKYSTTTIADRATTTITNTVLETETSTTTSTSVFITQDPRCQKRAIHTTKAYEYEERSKKPCSTKTSTKKAYATQAVSKGSTQPKGCADAPIHGYPCSIVSSACGCLGLAPTTKTFTTTKTVLKKTTKNVKATRTINTTSKTTITATETATITSCGK